MNYENRFPEEMRKWRCSVEGLGTSQVKHFPGKTEASFIASMHLRRQAWWCMPVTTVLGA